MADYLLGIDYGTGGAKACIIESSGDVLGFTFEEYPFIHEHSGWSGGPRALRRGPRWPRGRWTATPGGSAPGPSRRGISRATSEPWATSA
jgi:hypothetical protein